MVEIFARLDLSDQTIYNWRRQDCIDRGLAAAMTSAESAELTAAHERFCDLETELAATRRVNELL